MESQLVFSPHQVNIVTLYLSRKLKNKHFDLFLKSLNMGIKVAQYCSNHLEHPLNYRKDTNKGRFRSRSRSILSLF